MDILSKEEEKFILELFASHLREKSMEGEKLGIPDNGYIYHHVGEYQDRGDEFLKTEEFLKWVVENNPKDFSKLANISFINLVIQN